MAGKGKVETAALSRVWRRSRSTFHGKEKRKKRPGAPKITRCKRQERQEKGKKDEKRRETWSRPRPEWIAVQYRRRQKTISCRKKEKWNPFRIAWIARGLLKKRKKEEEGWLSCRQPVKKEGSAKREGEKKKGRPYFFTVAPGQRKRAADPEQDQ